MGLKYWWGGLIMISLFWIIIGTPCAVMAYWGSKVINDIGNAPSKNFQIQLSAWWIYVVQFFFFICLVGYGAFLINSNLE